MFMHAYFFALGSNTLKKKKIFSGNNLSSGTRYYSHFFFTLDLPRNLSAQALLLCRKVRTKKKVHVSLWLDMTSFPVEASRMAGISQGAAAREEGCCDSMALPEVLSKHFSDD